MFKDIYPVLSKYCYPIVSLKLSLINRKSNQVITIAIATFEQQSFFGNFVGCLYIYSRKRYGLPFIMEGAVRGGYNNICLYLYTVYLRYMDFHDEVRNSLLCWSAKNGHSRLCKYFISVGADCFENALAHAASGGHLNICKKLSPFILHSDHLEEIIYTTLSWAAFDKNWDVYDFLCTFKKK